MLCRLIPRRLEVLCGRIYERLEPESPGEMIGNLDSGYYVRFRVNDRNKKSLALLRSVYVANYWKRAVMKVTRDGQVSTVATSRWPWVPIGVALFGTDVYVLERMGNPYGPSTILEVSTLADRLGSPRLRKVSPDGAITTLVVVKGDRGFAVIVVPLILVILVAAALSVWLVRRRRAEKSARGRSEGR